MSRQVLITTLREYFDKKGTLTAEEYKEADDAPIRFQILRRKLGSWGRIINMVNGAAEEPTVTPVSSPPGEPAAVVEPVPVVPATKEPDTVKAVKSK